MNSRFQFYLFLTKYRGDYLANFFWDDEEECLVSFKRQYFKLDVLGIVNDLRDFSSIDNVVVEGIVRGY